MRAGAGEYTLSDLQAYLGQFPAAHYSHGGREPLLYCTVLLLSLQFRAAVAFLAQDASARDYRVDAPHLAIALTAHQVLALISNLPRFNLPRWAGVKLAMSCLLLHSVQPGTCE